MGLWKSFLNHLLDGQEPRIKEGTKMTHQVELEKCHLIEN